MWCGDVRKVERRAVLKGMKEAGCFVCGSRPLAEEAGRQLYQKYIEAGS
jgi:hypothetical protein